MVRAAAVKFAAGSSGVSLPTLANKLEYVFKKHLMPLAIKNKSKTQEDDKAFKLADKIFEEYSDPLTQVFQFFSKKKGSILNGRKDETLSIEELLNLLRTANILGDGTQGQEQSDI